MKKAVAIVVALLGLPTAAQLLESEPPPRDEPRPAPYLTSDRVDFRSVLPGPPSRGSFWEEQDRHVVDMLQGVSEERLRAAELDARFLYPRFSEAFGRDIDRKQLPQTVRLLNRAMRDVASSTFEAKHHFLRPRPFQSIQLKRVCGAKTPPAPEKNPKERSSYPSGHSAYGWAAAMILAKLRPERAEQLLRRAADYGDSRVVCGVHYPSDVASGRVIAAAVVSRLQANADFAADLERARAEVASLDGTKEP